MGTRLFKQLAASYPTKEEAWRRCFISAYPASVASVDEQIGRILDAVDESGLKDSTMIIVTSDHGWGMGEKDYLYKDPLWQESTQVPLWVSAPGDFEGECGVRATGILDRPLLPPLVDLCGLTSGAQQE